MRLEFLRRGGVSNTNPFTAAGNELNEQLVAQGLPAYAEAGRKNRHFSSMAVLAVAGLVVRPTVTAAFEIWNGYSDKSLIITDIFTFNLVATAIQGTYTPWAMVTAPKAAPSAGANVTINSQSGRSAPSGPVICGLGTTVVANGWRPVGTGPAFGLGTATPGGGIVQDQQGKFVVPPGCSLCLHTVSQTTAWTFQNGAAWIEEVITVEG